MRLSLFNTCKHGKCLTDYKLLLYDVVQQLQETSSPTIHIAPEEQQIELSFVSWGQPTEEVEEVTSSHTPLGALLDGNGQQRAASSNVGQQHQHQQQHQHPAPAPAVLVYPLYHQEQPSPPAPPPLPPGLEPASNDAGPDLGTDALPTGEESKRDSTACKLATAELVTSLASVSSATWCVCVML